jgi:hypothetical protein
VEQGLRSLRQVLVEPPISLAPTLYLRAVVVVVVLEIHSMAEPVDPVVLEMVAEMVAMEVRGMVAGGQAEAEG